jgi:hypothetical protein
MATETTSLAAHSYSVLAPATNNPVRTNKAIKSSKPMFHPPLSLARDLTLKRGDLTTVSPLQNSGLSPDHISNWDLSLAHALTFNRYDITAVPRLHISRRNHVGFHPGASAVSALHTSANLRPLNDRDNRADRGRSTDPNGARPQFSTEKSGKNSAGSAKPTHKESRALAPIHLLAFKGGNIPLINPSISVVTVVVSTHRTARVGAAHSDVSLRVYGLRGSKRPALAAPGPNEEEHEPGHQGRRSE